MNEFSNLARNFVHDAQYLAGRTTRETHLARYGDRDERKYSALAMTELADFVKAHSAPDDTIYVFGFSSGVYVLADRESASQILLEPSGHRRFPSAGTRLRRRRPAAGARRRHGPPSSRSRCATGRRTSATPPSSSWARRASPSWLRAHYDQADGPAGFDVWTYRGPRP